MAIFKGGPALPMRSASKAASPNRALVVFPLLSNRNEEPDPAMEPLIELSGESTDSTITDEDIEDIQTRPAVHGGFALPISNVRSITTAAVGNHDDKEVIRPRKNRKTNEGVAKGQPLTTPKSFVKAEPCTPTKRSLAESSKNVMKTPPRKQVSSPCTPKSEPGAGAWQAEHWNDLNFAILKVVHEHASELYTASPSLSPWRVKGRLLVKLRQALKDCVGGEVASKRWEVECKPSRGKGSPKKQ